MTIYGDETFGPITTVVRVKGVEEAVAVANDSDYGLSAAVFGRAVIDEFTELKWITIEPSVQQYPV
jgi:acyl-CoA reductase-like NAD-dependent aldehyde dehydrogenase